jgi:hypothetical protein
MEEARCPDVLLPHATPAHQEEGPDRKRSQRAEKEADMEAEVTTNSLKRFAEEPQHLSCSSAAETGCTGAAGNERETSGDACRAAHDIKQPAHDIMHGLDAGDQRRQHTDCEMRDTGCEGASSQGEFAFAAALSAADAAAAAADATTADADATAGDAEATAADVDAECEEDARSTGAASACAGGPVRRARRQASATSLSHHVYSNWQSQLPERLRARRADPRRDV